MRRKIRQESFRHPVVDFQKIKHESPDSSLPTRLVINVSGQVYETYEKTLAVYPNTLLGNLRKRRKFYNPFTDEYVFSRDTRCFDAILFFYQSSGILKRPEDVNRKVFEAELAFFEITASEGHQEMKNKPKLAMNRMGTTRKLLWVVLEQPFSTKWSFCIGVLNILLVLTSVAVYSVVTLSQFSTVSSVDETIDGVTGVVTKYSHIFFTIETVCMSWFTLEYFIRLLNSQRYASFVFSILGVIELATVVSFYLSLVVNHYKHRTAGLGHFSKFLRLPLVLQLFRLARYSDGLRGMLETLVKGIWQVHPIMVAASAMVTSFASLMFYAEVNNTPESSRNLFDWIWFVIITMTTVGYGDIYPRTILGKILGISCALFGVLLFCFLTPLILRYFFKVYYLPKYLNQDYSQEQASFIDRLEDFYFDD